MLVEAAARVLEERGLGGYTTNAVAERAGTSVGSLYQYFPGKDALTAALIERETAVLLADVGSAAGAPDPRDGLALFIAAAVGHQMRRPSLARLLDFEEVRLPLGDEVAGVSRTIVASVSALVARLPGTALADPDEAAADILAMVKGMVDAAGERGETASAGLDARVRRAVFGYLGLARAEMA